MRFLKPLLAGAAVLALAAPSLASAEPYFGDGGGHDSHRDGGYDHRDRGDGGYNHRDFADRGAGYDYGYRDNGYGYHHHWRMHHHWRDQRGW